MICPWYAPCSDKPWQILKTKTFGTNWNHWPWSNPIPNCAFCAWGVSLVWSILRLWVDFVDILQLGAGPMQRGCDDSGWYIPWVDWEWLTICSSTSFEGNQWLEIVVFSMKWFFNGCYAWGDFSNLQYKSMAFHHVSSCFAMFCTKACHFDVSNDCFTLLRAHGFGVSRSPGNASQRLIASSYLI